MKFAAFVPEYELLSWSTAPGDFQEWVQVVGGIATLALLIWGLSRLLKQAANVREGMDISWQPRHYMMAYLGGGAFLAYLGFALLYFGRALGLQLGVPQVGPGGSGLTPLEEYCFTGGAACALLVVAVPPLASIFGRMRLGRVWGLALLTIKEVLRGRILYVFAIIGVLFLFAGWFLQSRPEDQLRTYVEFVNLIIFLLFVVMAALLGSFSIPRDVKNQTIHTIVTKPVERFEVILGRFFGYGLILTVALAVLCALSWTYILRGVDQRAAKESFKARVSLFASKQVEFFPNPVGEHVGRMWDYRRYIMGPKPNDPNPAANRQYAVWSFDEVPDYLSEGDGNVRFEFTFDIFRINKHGDVRVTFIFADGSMPNKEIVAQLKKYDDDFEKLRNVKPLKELRNELINKYRMHMQNGVPVVDYHTEMLDVPSTLFAAVRQNREKSPPQVTGDDGKTPLIKALIYVDRPESHKGLYTQMVGVARHDLYIVPIEYPFWFNFVKGFVGIWFTVILILGIAVCCSAYLSGVISFLCTVFLCMAGMSSDFVQQIAAGGKMGRGPVESMVRVLHGRPLGQLEEAPSTTAIYAFDAGFRWMLRRFLVIIPDVNRYDLHNYVANGFNISIVDNLFWNGLIPLLLYLIPWLFGAYYLIQFREVANPT